MLEQFGSDLGGKPALNWVQDGLIGEGRTIVGSRGARRLIYADYVASGRALRQVEAFMLEHVLPFYANTHSESSYCGAYSTQLRETARARIAALTGAGPEHAVIFAGAGATAGFNRLVALLGVAAAAAAGERPVVLTGPYEHHSNILPWRESGAEVVEVPEAEAGGPDMDALAALLHCYRDRSVKVGTFSAASNVTGVKTDVAAVTAQLKAAGARVVWDFACAAPYCPIDMSPAEGVEVDAVVFSAHKFVGGPGASGVLIVRRDAVRDARPSWPGGGTVRFVSPWAHDYLDDVEAREESGTPNVLGDIRAGLALTVKDMVGQQVIDAREHELGDRALAAWDNHPALWLLGVEKKKRLPIFSFMVRHRAGGFVDPQLFTAALSDRYGIQARGGCSCAGPYGHRLLGIDRELSDRLRAAVLAGDETAKPGWVRLNFSYVMTDEAADTVIAAVAELAEDLWQQPAAADHGYVSYVRGEWIGQISPR
ncbi:MAG: aminotransferase class V-fold PLP-dependent enzyme [Devosia sp.]|nr:aminotransferase class V-fold PLP-dependent enzyme [Devosia sp.]